MGKLEVIVVFGLIAVLSFGGYKIIDAQYEASIKRTAQQFDFSKEIAVDVPTRHIFTPSSGYQIKELKNVGITFYIVGEPSVPGVTSKSGRHVYEGSIAVSHDLWNKEVKFGDIIYVKSTNKHYIAEDLMHGKYEKRVDIYTHDNDLAKSGSSRSDITIIRHLK